MKTSLPALLAALLLASGVHPACALAEEASTNATDVVAKARSELELAILKREYEALRLARVDLAKMITFTKIEMDSFKDKSLRQRDLKEHLEVYQEQLAALDKMIDEASIKVNQAMLKSIPAPKE